MAGVFKKGKYYEYKLIDILSAKGVPLLVPTSGISWKGIDIIHFIEDLIVLYSVKSTSKDKIYVLDEMKKFIPKLEHLAKHSSHKIIGYLAVFFKNHRELILKRVFIRDEFIRDTEYVSRVSIDDYKRVVACIIPIDVVKKISRGDEVICYRY